MGKNLPWRALGEKKPPTPELLNTRFRAPTQPRGASLTTLGGEVWGGGKPPQRVPSSPARSDELGACPEAHNMGEKLPWRALGENSRCVR